MIELGMRMLPVLALQGQPRATRMTTAHSPQVVDLFRAKQAAGGLAADQDTLDKAIMSPLG